MGDADPLGWGKFRRMHTELAELLGEYQGLPVAVPELQLVLETNHPLAPIINALNGTPVPGAELMAAADREPELFSQLETMAQRGQVREMEAGDEAEGDLMEQAMNRRFACEPKEAERIRNHWFCWRRNVDVYVIQEGNRISALVAPAAPFWRKANGHKPSSPEAGL